MNLWSPSTIVLVGAVIAAVGVFWADAQKSRQEMENLKREATLHKELADKSDELARKSDEIAALNKELLNSVTGGEGYPKLMMIGGLNSRIILYLMNSGKYPLPDVTATVFFISDSEASRKANPTFDFFELRALESQSTKTVNVGTLLPSAPFSLLPDFKLPDDMDEYSLEITTDARNGVVKNLVMFKKNPQGAWQWGFVSLGAKQERLQIVDSDNILPELWKNAPEPIFKVN
jgi:hypothetical protein